MANSIVGCYIHFIFSTRRRLGLLTPEIKELVWACIGEIARSRSMETLAIGGTANHVHLLVRFPTTLAVSKAIQYIKGDSSRWIHETFPAHRDFHWQEGYGAFSVGVSRIRETVSYIDNQGEYHRTRTFEQEYRAILDANGVQYDRRYLWG